MAGDRQSPALTGRRATGYFRVSTDMQAERGLSLEVQRDRYEAYVARHGLTDTGTYTDVISGGRSDRAQYQRMLTACRAGQVDIVVVTVLDRFGRDFKETLTRWWELGELGIRVEATDERLEDGEDLPSIIKAWMAAEERKRIGRRSLGGRRKRAMTSKTWLGPVPYGWRKVQQLEGGHITQQLVVYEPEAAIIRLLVAWCIAGQSMRSIAHRLNNEGYRTASDKPFSMARVWVLLTRPHNAGDAVWAATSDEPIARPEVLPAIISREDAERVAAQLAIRKHLPPRAATSIHLLTGLLRCGECGEPFAGRWAGQHGSVRAYTCTGAARYRACSMTYVNANRLDAAVLDALLSAADAEAATLYAPRETPQRDFADERRTCDRELAAADRELLDNLRLYRGGALTEQQLAVYNAETGRRRDAAEQRLRALEREQAAETRRHARLSALPGQVRSLLEGWEAADVATRKAALQQLVQRVTVFKDGRIKPDFRL